MDYSSLIADRARQINGSGIRAVFAMRARLQAEGKSPIDLSIGQPHFPVPEAVKRAAVQAIMEDRNGYTPNAGIQPLRERIAMHLHDDVGWRAAEFFSSPDCAVQVTAGTSGGLVLAFMALLAPGDEVVIPDPFFVAYPHMATMCHARAVTCPVYPDFKMTAERVEPLLTPRTKIVVLNSPGNPSGVVHTERECRDLLDLCRRRNIVLLSDEIYDLFTFSEARTSRSRSGQPSCPSPARFAGSHENVVLVRGFGKTYGVTGWRLGWLAGHPALVEQMNKIQQYLYVCAPHPLQWGAAAAMDVRMDEAVAAYEKNRDHVVSALGGLTELARPAGAFYAFPRVPERLGLSGSEFAERCVKANVLVVPGKAFSERDTHFRISFATDPGTLSRGLDALAKLLKGETPKA